MEALGSEIQGEASKDRPERVVVQRELHLPIDLLYELQSHYFPGHWDDRYDPLNPDSWPYFRLIAADEFEAALVTAIKPDHVHSEILIAGSTAT